MKKSIQNGVKIFKDVSIIMDKMRSSKTDQDFSHYYILAHKKIVEANRIISKELGKIYSEMVSLK